ncbi:MAG: tRNA lysidine(34) synthetase TilS [Saprospiraceae bacterium]|nr:tRNA lysidine(34) synthetase TilS [Saprospiraceae bacterium]
MDLLQQFQAFYRSENLLQEGTRFLVAVSGGIDSMVLVHLCHSSGLLFDVAHVNFGLRGEASDGDEAYVWKTGQLLGLKVFTHKFETAKEAAEKHISIQMAARQLRYGWFETLCDAYGYSCVATGHNLNDQVETLLINLKRGTGIQGLTGIPKRQGRVVRPLAFATRAEIESYALENGIVWREDSSNAQTEYTRNRIRHTILPVFEALNPNFLHTSERTMERLSADSQNLDALIATTFPTFDATQSPAFISLSTLTALPSPAGILRRLLHNLHFSDDQIVQLSRKLNERGFEVVSESGKNRLGVEKDVLRLDLDEAKQVPEGETLIHADDVMVTLPGGKKLILSPTIPGPPFPDGKEAVTVDFEQLVFPLMVRKWSPGDVFQPIGMQGKSQKIQDFLVNQKASRREKEQLVLLVNGNGSIIWIPGYRPDERFKIGPATRNALKIALF